MIQHKTKPHTGRRVIATIIDYAVILALTILYILTFGEPNEEGVKTVSGLAALILIIPWFIYLIIVETYCGATLGHMIVNLKVVSQNGAKPSFGQIVKRRISDALEISWCFGLIAFILVLNTKQNQRLGDILANTLVIDKNEILTDLEFDFEKSITQKNGS